MSGRIALMVKGLPSIGIDEAVERFGKYYAKPSSDQKVFHTSPSFTGLSSENAISFINNKTGGFSGGGGLNQQVMADLRRLQKDFNDYTQANQGIYTNSPTSASRAKLYRRVGFRDMPHGGQVLDSRRISPIDNPYVQAIDMAVLPELFNKALGRSSPLPFLKTEDGIVSAQRLNKTRLLGALRGNPISTLAIELDVGRILDTKRHKRIAAKFNKFGEYIDTPPTQISVFQPSAFSNQSFQGIIDDYDDIPF